MNKNYLLVVCFMFTAFFLLGQDEQSSSQFPTGNSIKIHLQGYSFLFPGAEVAYEFSLWNKKLNGEKSLFQVNVGPQLEYYRLFGFHNGISLGLDLNTKYITKKGFEYSLFGSGGLLQTVLIVEVYELQEDGTFESSRGRGNKHLQLKAGFGLGYNMMVRKSKPMSVNLRFGIRQQNMPASPLVFTISAGINYYLNQSK